MLESAALITLKATLGQRTKPPICEAAPIQLRAVQGRQATPTPMIATATAMVGDGLSPPNVTPTPQNAALTPQ